MKIIGLHPYRDGYKGFLQHEGKYIYFSMAAGKFRIMIDFPCDSYSDRHHFIEVYSRYFKRNMFLDTPIDIEFLSLDALRKAYFSRYSGVIH